MYLHPYWNGALDQPSSLTGVEVVLCASVTNEEWLVHMGSLDENGELNARNPFQARDLLLKDLTAGNGVQLHKRIRQHLHRGQLRAASEVSPRVARVCC